MQWPVRGWRVITQQIEDATALERGRTPFVLLQGRPAKGIQQDLQRRLDANLMQGFAFVLEDLLPSHVFGIQHATLCRAVHVLDQITR